MLHNNSLSGTHAVLRGEQWVTNSLQQWVNSSAFCESIPGNAVLGVCSPEICAHRLKIKPVLGPSAQQLPARALIWNRWDSFVHNTTDSEKRKQILFLILQNTQSHDSRKQWRNAITTFDLLQRVLKIKWLMLFSLVWVRIFKGNKLDSSSFLWTTIDLM